MKRKTNDEYSVSAKRNINYLVDTYCDGKQVVFCEKTGLSKGSVSQYCSGNNVPNNKTAKKIADVFNVNPAWVMGLDEQMTRREGFRVTAVPLQEELRHDFETRLQETIEMHKILSNDEVELVHEWRRLDEIGQHFIMSVIRHELDRIKK
jgi:transcriptional regulator with XRE-family HTH domain